MTIQRILTRKIACDGCGKSITEVVDFGAESIEEDWDHIDSRDFKYISLEMGGIVCVRKDRYWPKRSCLEAAYKKAGLSYTECDLEGHQDKIIGHDSDDCPKYKCLRCGRKYTGINSKKANRVLKELYSPREIESLTTNPFLTYGNPASK